MIGETEMKEYYNPFYIISEFNPDFLIVLGTKCTGKTLGTTSYIEKYMTGKTVIIKRTKKEILYTKSENSPFYWNTQTVKKGKSIYKNGIEIARFVALSDIKTDEKMNVIYNPYGSMDFQGFTNVLFDDCNYTQKQGSSADFNKFIEILRTMLRCNQGFRITSFINLNYYYNGCDIPANLGFTQNIVENIRPGETIVRDYKGLRVCFHKID